jgi:hypothetical protein
MNVTSGGSMNVPAQIRLLRILSFFLQVLFLGCAANPIPLKIENSLPPDKLAYYSDSFDTFREDLWGKNVILYKDTQMVGFQLADIICRGGKLVFTTQKDCFSKASLDTKYRLKGDFDIQMDCRFSPIRDLQPMDQVMGLGLYDKGSGENSNQDVIRIVVFRGLGQSKTFLMSTSKNSTGRSPYRKEIGDFDGSLRMNRTGRTLSTYYRQKGKEWQKLSAFPVSTADLTFGFTLQNFTHRTNNLRSALPFTAEFSEFKINAAQGIIEEEI